MMIGVLLALFQLSTALNEITISSAEQSSSRNATSLAGKAIDDDLSTSSYTEADEKSWITLKLNTSRRLNKVVIRGQAATDCDFEVHLTLKNGSTKFCEEYTVAGLYNKNVKFWGGRATAINISEKEACNQTMQMYEIKVFGPCERGYFSVPEEIGRYTLVDNPWNNMTRLICTECAPGSYSETRNGKEDCDVCGAGMWSDAGAEQCTPCIAGKWRADGDSGCTECEAGWWSVIGAAECTECEAGWWSVIGAAECTECAAGTWSVIGAAECTECAAGWWSVIGAAGCTACTGGKTSKAGSTGAGDCYYGKKLNCKRNCANCFYFTRLRLDPKQYDTFFKL